MFPGTKIPFSPICARYSADCKGRRAYRWSKELFSFSRTQPNSLRYLDVCLFLPPHLSSLNTQLTLIVVCSVVNPVSTFTPDKLNEASSACRKLFFNTRLGTLCRPEFMLKGDGLASTYAQAERLSIDYWGRLNEVLTGVSLP